MGTVLLKYSDDELENMLKELREKNKIIKKKIVSNKKTDKLKDMLTENEKAINFLGTELYHRYSHAGQEREKEEKKQLEKREIRKKNFEREAEFRRKTYDVILLTEMLRLELTMKPKPKQFQCLIEANRNIKTYKDESELMDKIGEPTDTALDLIKSYKKRKHDLKEIAEFHKIW